MRQGGTHYGNMFNEHAAANLLIEPVETVDQENQESNNSSIIINVNN
jgi:hypothetical protein